MESLGRLFNVHPVADDVYVSMRNCESMTFICVNASGDTWTLTEATAVGGTGAQVLATITTYHVAATVGAAWVRVNQAAGSAFTTSAAQDVAVVTIRQPELSDGYKYVKLTSTGAGTVVALAHELKYMREPANLPSLIV